MRSFLASTLLSLVAVSCGSQTETLVNQRVGDSAVATDAPVAAEDTPATTEDATPPPPWTPPEGTDPACVTGSRWTGGNRESPFMNPGQACQACHVRSRGAPQLTAGGTVYYLDHETNNCNGYSGTVPGGMGGTAYVELVDANNRTVRLRVNAAGNFYTQTALAFPLMTARVIGPTGLINEMSSPVPHGDCNGCHSQMGTSTVAGADPAPGRVVVPL